MKKRIFIPISTIIIIRTNVSSEQLSTTSEQSNSKNIKYIQITEGDVEFNDPLSNVNVKPSLRLEYPAITMMSIESQRLNVQYGNKVYTTGVKWGSPASSGSYDKHAYKSIIHNSSAEILDYKVYTDVTNYEEASNIGTSLSVASFLLGLVLSIICPPASALEWTIFIASYTSGLVSIVYDIAGGKHTIVVTRTISYGDIFTAGNTGYAKATIYVSYPSISDGIDNLIRFFGSERHSLAFLESKYEDVITDKDSKYFLFDVTQYRWYHTYSIPYDLFRDNPSLQLAIFGLEKIHISYTLFLSIVEHSIDGQSHYLRINGAEKIVYQQVEIYRLLGARYGWNS